ncbi:MAG: MATE family efflux transporter [Clostridiales bacterium]|nr:MATE family efflux transporter [Eubacteriales bacterium]MDH7567249.1 MATE family efflux transporter [Clostridiales bacterium]
MDNTQRIGEEKVSKLLLDFSIPAIIGMLVSALYNVIDRIFIGNSAGSLGIAGITIGFPIMVIQMAFGGLIGMGATSLVSIRLGQQKREEAELIMGNAIMLLSIITAVITVAGLTFLNPLLRVFGASNEVLPYARDYMSIILCGSVFQTFSFGLNNFIRAEGKPKIAMATMLIGTILNACLAPLFIFVFHWGIRGAAFATVISQAVSATWIITHFVRGKSTLKIRRQNFKLKKDIVTGILAIGIAPFAMQLAQCLLSAIMNQSLEYYGGDIAISGMGVIMSLMTLIMMPMFGINQGAQPIIGFNYGAKKYDRVKEALKYAVLAATTIATIGFIVTRLFPSQLIALFNSRDKELIAFGSHAILVNLIFLPIIGFQIIGSGYFQAVGKPKQSMILSLSRQLLILIPALLILPRFFQLQGVLVAGPVADLLSSIITGVWLFFELRNLTQKQENNLVPKLADEE